MSETKSVSFSTCESDGAGTLQVNIEIDWADEGETSFRLTATSSSLTASRTLSIDLQDLRQFELHLSHILQGAIAEGGLCDTEYGGRIAIGCREADRPLLSFQIVVHGPVCQDDNRVIVEAKALAIETETVHRIRTFIAEWLAVQPENA